MRWEVLVSVLLWYSTFLNGSKDDGGDGNTSAMPFVAEGRRVFGSACRMVYCCNRSIRYDGDTPRRSTHHTIQSITSNEEEEEDGSGIRLATAAVVVEVVVGRDRCGTFSPWQKERG